MSNDIDRFDLFYPKRKEQTMDTPGYRPEDVPVYGRIPVRTEVCRIESPTEGKDCGCGWGQCALGGIW